MVKKRTKTAMQSEAVKAKIPNKLDIYKDKILNLKEEGLNPNQITKKLQDDGLDINKAQVYRFIKKN